MRELDRLLDSQELADYLGLPIATIYVWAARGSGPERIRVGRHTRYRISAVNEWLDSQVKPVRGEPDCGGAARLVQPVGESPAAVQPHRQVGPGRDARGEPQCGLA